VTGHEKIGLMCTQFNHINFWISNYVNNFAVKNNHLIKFSPFMKHLIGNLMQFTELKYSLVKYVLLTYIHAVLTKHLVLEDSLSKLVKLKPFPSCSDKRDKAVL